MPNLDFIVKLLSKLDTNRWVRAISASCFTTLFCQHSTLDVVAIDYQVKVEGTCNAQIQIKQPFYYLPVH